MSRAESSANLQDRAATAVRFVETTVDALLALAAFAVTGLVATVAILWLVPLLLAAAIAPHWATPDAAGARAYSSSSSSSRSSSA